MEFNKQIWEVENGFEKWLEYTPEYIQEFGLKDSTVDSLRNGLPDGAAPFLTFYSEKEQLKLCTLKDYFDLEEEEAKAYIVFGSDGGGNLLCIDKTDDDRIILFDHESFEITGINKNLSDFLNCILIYRKFVNLIQIKYGSSGFIESSYARKMLIV